MSGIKDKKAFKILTNKYLLVTFVFLLIVVFLDSNNLIRWGKDYIEVLRQQNAIRQYEKDIKDIDEKLQELSSDKDSLEKFAREQYYFQEDGEDVFIVE